jgi:hypothetical protein
VDDVVTVPKLRCKITLADNTIREKWFTIAEAQFMTSLSEAKLEALGIA